MEYHHPPIPMPGNEGHKNTSSFFHVPAALHCYLDTKSAFLHTLGSCGSGTEVPISEALLVVNLLRSCERSMCLRDPGSLLFLFLLLCLSQMLIIDVAVGKHRPHQCQYQYPHHLCYQYSYDCHKLLLRAICSLPNIMFGVQKHPSDVSDPALMESAEASFQGHGQEDLALGRGLQSFELHNTAAKIIAQSCFQVYWQYTLLHSP